MIEWLAVVGLGRHSDIKFNRPVPGNQEVVTWPARLVASIRQNNAAFNCLLRRGTSKMAAFGTVSSSVHFGTLQKGSDHKLLAHEDCLAVGQTVQFTFGALNDPAVHLLRLLKHWFGHRYSWLSFFQLQSTDYGLYSPTVKFPSPVSTYQVLGAIQNRFVAHDGTQYNYI